MCPEKYLFSIIKKVRELMPTPVNQKSEIKSGTGPFHFPNGAMSSKKKVSECLLKNEMKSIGRRL